MRQFCRLPTREMSAIARVLVPTACTPDSPRATITGTMTVPPPMPKNPASSPASSPARAKTNSRSIALSLGLPIRRSPYLNGWRGGQWWSLSALERVKVVHTSENLLYP